MIRSSRLYVVVVNYFLLLGLSEIINLSWINFWVLHLASIFRSQDVQSYIIHILLQSYEHCATLTIITLDIKETSTLMGVSSWNILPNFLKNLEILVKHGPQWLRNYNIWKFLKLTFFGTPCPLYSVHCNDASPTSCYAGTLHLFACTV